MSLKAVTKVIYTYLSLELFFPLHGKLHSYHVLGSPDRLGSNIIQVLIAAAIQVFSYCCSISRNVFASLLHLWAQEDHYCP